MRGDFPRAAHRRAASAIAPLLQQYTEQGGLEFQDEAAEAELVQAVSKTQL